MIIKLRNFDKNISNICPYINKEGRKNLPPFSFKVMKMFFVTVKKMFNPNQLSIATYKNLLRVNVDPISDVIALSQVDPKLSLSLTQLKNSKPKFDSNSIEFFCTCLKLNSKNSRATRALLYKTRIN